MEGAAKAGVQLKRQLTEKQAVLDQLSASAALPPTSAGVAMSKDEQNQKLGGHIALLKVMSTKTCEYVAREAVQIFGGAGIRTNYPPVCMHAERWKPILCLCRIHSHRERGEGGKGVPRGARICDSRR